MIRKTHEDPFEDEDPCEDVMDVDWDEVVVAGLSGPAERVADGEVDEDEDEREDAVLDPEEVSLEEEDDDVSLEDREVEEDATERRIYIRAPGNERNKVGQWKDNRRICSQQKKEKSGESRCGSVDDWQRSQKSNEQKERER